MFIKYCLDCEHEIDLGSHPEVGQKITCPNCGVRLEVLNLEPLELDWVYDGPVINMKLFDADWRASPPTH